MWTAREIEMPIHLSNNALAKAKTAIFNSPSPVQCCKLINWSGESLMKSLSKATLHGGACGDTKLQRVYVKIIEHALML